MTRYAIGDVQGCFQSLQALLLRIDFDPANDEIWLAGDLVNRGPGSLEVVRWAMAHNVTAVLGNHDLHLLCQAVGVRKPKRSDTLAPIFGASDSEELIDWFRHRPLIARHDQTIMVHAGLLPSWTIAQAEALAREIEDALRGPKWRKLLKAYHGSSQPWSEQLEGKHRLASALTAMTHLRCMDGEGIMNRSYTGPPCDMEGGMVPWFDHPDRKWTGVRIIFGHWAAMGLHMDESFWALDSGCVWGGQLTAVRWDDGKVFQQPALETRTPDPE